MCNKNCLVFLHKNFIAHWNIKNMWLKRAKKNLSTCFNNPIFPSISNPLELHQQLTLLARFPGDNIIQFQGDFSSRIHSVAKFLNSRLFLEIIAKM